MCVLAGIQSVGIGACMHVCVWYTELTCISNGASKTDIVVGKVLSVCVCVLACLCVCGIQSRLIYHTSRTHVSRTDIVGQVLGPSVC